MRLVYAFVLLLLLPALSFAHCDTWSGPVVQDAQKALEKGDVALVLKWVHADREAEARAAFDRAFAVRSAGPQARELADRYFFETIVRLHRAGEGAPFTGLKSEQSVEPEVAAADRALDSGDVEKLAAEAGRRVADSIRARYAAARDARQHAAENVELGRKYVAAYVEYVHLVERAAAMGAAEGSQHQADEH